MKKNFIGTASLLRRILAFIFDLLVINLIIIRPFKGLLERILGTENSYKVIMALAEQNASLVQHLTFVLFFISALALFYFTIFEYKYGQTLGQMLFKLHVRAEKGKLKFWQCLINNMFIMPFFPFFILWAIDPFYMFYSGKRFSEKIAKTKMEQEYVMKYGKK